MKMIIKYVYRITLFLISCPAGEIDKEKLLNYNRNLWCNGIEQCCAVLRNGPEYCLGEMIIMMGDHYPMKILPTNESTYSNQFSIVLYLFLIHQTL